MGALLFVAFLAFATWRAADARQGVVNRVGMGSDSSGRIGPNTIVGRQQRHGSELTAAALSFALKRGGEQQQ